LEFNIQQFNGPLDLLLQLISEKRMEISEISISTVTEQYLDHLDKLEKDDPQDLADFLVVAAKLLLLKSKTLLPQFTPEEDEEGSLEAQLKLYKAFVEASKKIEKRWNDGSVSYGRVEAPTPQREVYKPDNLKLETMHQTMVQLVDRLAPPRPMPQTYIDKSVSLRDKVDFLRKMLKKNKNVNFKEMLLDAQSRTEVIVSFLAILELVKQKSVFLQQDDSFGNIVISSV